MLRAATIRDVPRIGEIINSHAELGKMLFKSYAQLYEDLRDFCVLEKDGQVVGTVALSIIWADLAEVRSLAVDDQFRGQGIGRRLVEWCVDEARRLQIRRIMSLTYEQGFFEKLGFEVVAKETLPLKVWSDCVRCPKRDGCDEIAMVRFLHDVPIISAPTATPTPRGVSIPVLEHVDEDRAPMVDQMDTGGRGLGWRLFALSFAALFLELMLIRWVPSVVRLVAYYANLMLISSFLGLGAGAIASTKGWRLARWFLPLLVAEVAFVLLCRYVAMPGSGSEVRFYQSHPRLVGYLALVGIFALNTLTFMPLGQQVGELFNRMPTLRAYTWDLGGSLCGTICFAAFSLFAFSPAIGIAIAIGIAAAAGLVRRRVPELAMAVVVVAVVFFAARRDAIWSPYYYILVDHKDSPAGAPPADVRTMKDPPAYNVRVNQDFYQGHFTLDRARYSAGVVPEELAMAEKQYHLPYIARPGAKRVLVLGSGGGVDAEVALLNGVEHVDAVEIDPALVALSRRYNSSGVYNDPRVHVHVDDGRAFLQRTAGGYDVIVFGFLDSQGLSSYGNNLRLDGYIYTVESFRRAFNALAPDGWMSLSFAAPREWIARKLVAMVAEATGVRPIVYQAGSQLIVLAPRGGIPDRVPNLPPFELVNLFGPDAPPRATDDWPYLYLQARAVPGDYVTVIATLLALSVAGVIALRGRQIGTDDAHFFFLGLGFLLLQAKSIGDCSLYFGATWFVTTVVITGVLMMVLAANLIAIRLKRASLAWYVPLLASLLVLTFMPRDTVLGWAYGQRLAWALLVVPLPIFFAGLIFSTTFRNAAVPSAVFGANLIGATVGGFAEYLGMAIGTHALWWIVIAAYGASLLSRLGRRGHAQARPVAMTAAA